jgi:hypothetical protein
VSDRIRVRIVGKVRPGEDLTVDLIREIEDLDVGDSFRIGEDRVQIVSLSRSFESQGSKGFDAEWTIAPLPTYLLQLSTAASGVR